MRWLEAGWLDGGGGRCLDDMKHTLASGATQEYRTSRWGEARTSSASGSPRLNPFDQNETTRCQRCSQAAHQSSAGKHSLSIALQRHIIIVTIVYDIRKRSTARHFPSPSPGGPRRRTEAHVRVSFRQDIGRVLRKSDGWIVERNFALQPPS